MKSLVAALADLLFPPCCLGCERRLDSSRPPLFCADCAAHLAFIRSPLCYCCGNPFVTGADHLCGDCLAGHQAFDLARSLFHYQPPIAHLIRALKFRGNLAGLVSFRALINQENFSATFTEPDLVLPVPLHNSRLRERSFNQALLIAKNCLPQWQGKIAASLLLRHRPTSPQTSLTGKERRLNLRQAFTLSNPTKITGAKVLLVDDVYTTGSTVNECSRILRKAGAMRIEVFTLARSVAR
jgi:ComF family protein